tara:strand:+ start:748 stop:1548 length:801 start_codon:yes stop_codon:yes gene_type:complete
MKNFLFLFIVLIVFKTGFSQIAVMEEVTLKEGVESDYLKLEKMWSNVHEKIHEMGQKAGWFLFKVVPADNGVQWPPNSSTPWCDYVIFNIYSDKAQNDGNWGVGNTPKEAQDFIRKANYNKMKNSEISRLLKIGNLRENTTTYTMETIDATIDVGSIKTGDRALILGIEQLNEDYENYEMKWFKNGHNEAILNGQRLAWYLNRISARSDNAYKPVSHIIFERFNPTPAENVSNPKPSFVDEMMSKHGTASRKIHGGLYLELVDFKQ